ncbi:putative copper homeostasis (lipo)protein LpqS [Mycobacterium simulans]|uniref:hypothetical protein n=1 Tax=Mycobacterium simulans TaxID=627089 RepID=UPI0029670DC7|nr:hypothetical protein [Mycobacterium simulans]
MKGRRVVVTRSAIAAVALAWVVAAIAAQCWLPQIHRHATHPNHPLVTSVGKEFAVNIDHAHLSDNSTPSCPEQFATGVLPRSAAQALEAAAIAVAVGIAGVLTCLVVRAGRGPPPVLASACTGQDLLTRFCLARR